MTALTLSRNDLRELAGRQRPDAIMRWLDVQRIPLDPSVCAGVALRLRQLLRRQSPHLIVIAHHHRQIGHERLDDLAWRPGWRDERGLRWQGGRRARNLNGHRNLDDLRLDRRCLGCAAGEQCETNRGQFPGKRKSHR